MKCFLPFLLMIMLSWQLCSVLLSASFSSYLKKLQIRDGRLVSSLKVATAAQVHRELLPRGNGAGGSGEQHIRMDHLQRSVEVGQLQIDLPPLLIILAVHAHRRRLDNARQAAGHLKAVGGVGAREGAMVRPGHHQAAALELVEQAEQRPAGVLKLAVVSELKKIGRRLFRKVTTQSIYLLTSRKPECMARLSSR